MNQEIEELTNISTNYALTNFPWDYEILKSAPGIGDITADTLLAEIGYVKDFTTGDKLSSWLVIVPRVYQSADKLYPEPLRSADPEWLGGF